MICIPLDIGKWIKIKQIALPNYKKLLYSSKNVHNLYFEIRNKCWVQQS